MPRNEHTQNDHFTIKGHWWLPNSDKKVAGDLHYDEESISLSLYGGLIDATASSQFSATPCETKHSVILGISDNNTPITVLDSFYVAWKPDSAAIPFQRQTEVTLISSQLHCRTILQGIHLISPDNTFSSCRIEVPHLNNWLEVSPFTIKISDPIHNIHLDYTFPKEETFEISTHNCLVRFTHSATPPSSPPGDSPTITHRAYIEIESSTPKPFDYHVNLASEIVEFLTVAYGFPINSRSIMFKHPSNDWDWVPAFYARHKVKEAEKSKNEFLLRYKCINTSFQAILQNWLSSKPNLKRARKMLLSSERAPSKFIELRFLPLVQAAEVLSNEASQTTVISTSEFKAIRNRMIEAIKDNIPSELIQGIKNSLQWANGRSLTNKILSLLSELQCDTCHLFSTIKEQFVTGIVQTRNHYTHYSTKNGKKILQGFELHWGIQKLSLMLRILLLTKTGVPEQALRETLRSHSRLVQERSVWTTISEVGSEYQESDNA